MQFESFIENINTSHSVEEMHRLFTCAMEQFGFDANVYSLITPHRSVGLSAGHGIMHNYPNDWLTYYIDNSYGRIDPVIKRAFYTTAPFTWDSLRSDNLDEPQKQLLDEAHEAGLRSGVGIPLYGAAGEIAGFGLSSKDNNLPLTRSTLQLLQAYAMQFHAAYIHLHADANSHEISLTSRESEVLHWLAEGKSLPDIAIILSISEDTVRFHVKAIYQKLGANQRIAAVLTAIRHGILNPYRVIL